MASYNKVILMGNLTRDPEVRATPSGQSVTALGLACNRTYMAGGRDGQGGEKKEEVTFIDVDFWGRRGEVIAQYFKKGDPIFIEGRLTYRQWDDKEGHKRTKLSVTAESFEFVGGRREGGGGGGGGGAGMSGGRGPREMQSDGGSGSGGDLRGGDLRGGEMEAGIDEVPF
jgi:single-strand DNA-binding protein